jgi:hypothetical protein
LSDLGERTAVHEDLAVVVVRFEDDHDQLRGLDDLARRC